jgi:hypothetical protein
MAKSLRFTLRLPKEEICYVSWTIDAYEGVAFLRNEGEEGVVSIMCSSDYSGEVESIIRAFETEGIAVERILSGK